MRKSRTLALGAVLLALVASACTPGGSGSSSPAGSGAASGSQSAEKPTVKVGSAGFYEAVVVAEMYAQALEAKGFTVERHLEIGERPAVHAAMDAGDVNLIPDYLGGLAGALTESADLPADPQAAWDKLQAPLSSATSRPGPMRTASPSGPRLPTSWAWPRCPMRPARQTSWSGASPRAAPRIRSAGRA